MRRWIAVLWQASFLVVAGILYFLFVLPRWNELTGDWSHGLGTAMRIVAGVLIGLAALPVTFTLIKSRKPEYGTPALALSLRLWSIVLHVLAGVLIVGGAIAEIWLSLDSAGQWLFGIYGAAAAIALLGALAFYLAYVAEMAPPAPKPLKSKKGTRGRGRGRRKGVATDADVADEVDDADEAPATSDDEDSDPDEDSEDTEDESVEDDTVVADAPEAPATVKAPAIARPTVTTDVTEPADAAAEAPEAETAEEDAPEEQSGKLRNRRPSGKTPSRLRRRSRGGVALED